MRILRVFTVFFSSEGRAISLNNRVIELLKSTAVGFWKLIVINLISNSIISGDES
jgi:hypothetical protein